MNKKADIKKITKEDIKAGKYGLSGARFISVRRFSKQNNIAFATAYKIFCELKNDGYLYLLGNTWYITYGVADKNSALLKNKTNKIIGFHAREINNDYISKIIEQISKYLSEKGIKLIISVSGNAAEKEREILNEFINMHAMAVINFATTNRKLYNFYKRYPLPMAFIGRKIGDTNMPNIRINNYESGKHLVDHLLSFNYTELFYIGPDYYDDNENNRLSGFLNELNQKGIEFNSDRIIKFTPDKEINLSHFINEIRELQKTKRVGLFCYNDLFAVNILSLLKKNNIKVPERVGIIGYDNLPVGRYTTPALSTISYNYSDIAKAAVDVVLQIYEGKKSPLYDMVISNHLTVRGSTVKI